MLFSTEGLQEYVSGVVRTPAGHSGTQRSAGSAAAPPPFLPGCGYLGWGMCLSLGTQAATCCAKSRRSDGDRSFASVQQPVLEFAACAGARGLDKGPHPLPFLRRAHRSSSRRRCTRSYQTGSRSCRCSQTGTSSSASKLIRGWCATSPRNCLPPPAASSGRTSAPRAHAASAPQRRKNRNHDARMLPRLPRDRCRLLGRKGRRRHRCASSPASAYGRFPQPGERHDASPLRRHRWGP